jgi:hypothetical protein
VTVGLERTIAYFRDELLGKGAERRAHPVGRARLARFRMAAGIAARPAD